MRGGVFCDDSTKAINGTKSVTMWGKVSKVIKNCVTSFMNGPLSEFTLIVSFSTLELIFEIFSLVLETNVTISKT